MATTEGEEVKRKIGKEIIDDMEGLAKAIGRGDIVIQSVRVNACLACARKGDDGTFRSRSLPDWMNRWVCDKCGKEVSQ